LEIIHTLYQEKSISKAAQVLYISQPALTSRFHQIEQDLGTVLALRTSKGLKFTPEGEIVAKEAESLLREFSQIRENIRAMSKGISGTLKISSSQFMMKYFLPNLLRDFKIAIQE